MASVNKVILVGNLGKYPETRYMPNGDAVCNITIATTDSWKDKATGEKKEAAEWQDKDGNDRYTTEIVADTMQMLGGRGQGGGESAGAPQQRSQGNAGGGSPARRAAPGGSMNDFEDDIPFASCAIEHDVIGRRLERRLRRAL